MDTQLLSRLPLEQARCRELARQFTALGSIGCFASALIEEALRRADRAIIDGCEEAVRRALKELQAFGSATSTPIGLDEPAGLRATAALPTLGTAPRFVQSGVPAAVPNFAPGFAPRLAIAVPPVGRRPSRMVFAAAA